MAIPKRPEGSMDKVFNRILLGSLLLHVAAMFLMMNVEPPPPPSQEEYATWLKKVAPPKVEAVPEPEAKPTPQKVEKEEELPEEEVVKAPPKEAPGKAAAAARGAPGAASRRAEVRKQLSGAGLLASIGVAAEGGSLANVFESGAVVGESLSEALSERGGVRVTGGTRIGKKGALGAGTSADIGEVETGAGGSAGALAGRQGVVPQAFVKSTEPVLEKGVIDERGVRMALTRRERGIQQCYERALKKNPKLKGKVAIKWVIDEQGRVVADLTKVLSNTLGETQVADCIVDIIGRIRFPKPTKGKVPVTKTFVFEAG